MLFEAQLRSVLIDVVRVAAIVCGALLVADVVLSLLARAGHGTRAATSLRRLSPPLVRHAAELVVTALVTLGAARPAGASPTPVRDWLRQPTTTTTPVPTTTTTTPVPTTTTTTVHVSPRLPSVSVPPSPAPSPPVAAPPPVATPSPTPAPVAPDRYVVQAGDCLWRIAARRLGPGATNHAIDGAWRAIYAANRAAVGDDPGLIHPGLVLTLPPLAAAH